MASSPPSGPWEDLRGATQELGAEPLAGLGLSEAEREDLMALREKLQDDRRDMRDEMAPLRRKLIDEVRQPSLDEERLGELLQERSTYFVAHIAGVMAALHTFLDRLAPEKKEAFLARIEEDPRFLFRFLRGSQRQAQR